MSSITDCIPLIKLYRYAHVEYAGVTWDFPPPPPPWISFPRIKYHHGKSPPPPWISFPRIKYHMVKVPHIWDLYPPKQIAHTVPILHITHHGICVGGDLSYRGNVCHMVLFPHGEVLPWDFFRGGGGEVCHMTLFPPWGSSAMGFLPGGRFAIWYSFMGNVCHMV